MKKLILILLIFSSITNSCIVSTTIEDPNDDFNIASHNEPVYLYKSFKSDEHIVAIPAETNFRVDRKIFSTKKYKRRKVIYGNYRGWVQTLSYKNEMDYGKWAHERVMEQIGVTSGSSTSGQSSISSYGQGHVYQTGPRGGQY